MAKTPMKVATVINVRGSAVEMPNTSAYKTSGNSKYGTLCEELICGPAPPGPHGRPYGHFVSALGTPCEEDIRHIRCGYE